MFSCIKLLLSLGRSNNLPNDHYEKEYEQIEKEQKEERLSIQISHLINKTAVLLSEDRPYPTSALRSIDDLHSLMSSISTQTQQDYFLKSVDLAQKLIFDEKDMPLHDESSFAIKKALFNSFSNDGAIDISEVQNIVLDKYFLTFKDYWESVISELKRRDAVVNRRKYLVELTEKFSTLLEQKGITKYSQLLSDYRSFNLSILESLRQEIA